MSATLTTTYEPVMTIEITQDLDRLYPTTPRNQLRTSRHRAKKSANDVRVDPASTEVISSLLASLSSVSVVEDGGSPLVPRSQPRTPSPHSARPSASFTHSSRPSVAYSRSSIKPRDARDPSIDYPEMVHPPLPAVPIELPPEGDVAQPPTIRTSRRPSGYSKVTAPKQPRRSPSDTELRNQYGLIDSITVPPSPLGQISSTPGTAPRNKNTSGKNSTDEARRAKALGQRDSLLVHRSKEAKGKQRAKHDSISSLEVSVDGSIPRSSSRLRMLSPRSARTYLSKQSSRAASIREDDESSVADGPARSLPQSASAEEFVVVHKKPRDPKPGIHHGRKFIPSRSSSLRQGSSSPNSSHLLSRRSSRHSFHKSPETVPEEDLDLGDGTRAIGSQQTPTLNELDEDHETVKRIRELQLAKEARQRMQVVDELPVRPTEGVRNPMAPSLVDTSQATGMAQGLTAELLDEASQRPGDTGTRHKDNRAITDQTFLLPPGPDSPVGFTLDGVRTPRPEKGPRSPKLNDAASQNTPGPPMKSSFTSSPLRNKSQRWSNADVLPGRPSLNRLSGSQKNINVLPKLPAEQDARASIDSVNMSVKEFVQAPRLSQKIQASTENRQISFSEVGDPKGHVVICCVGMGMTRYVMAFYDELAASMKLRLITPERPGVGDSGAYGEPKAPLHWPDDVRAICTHLHIQRFSLLAHSAGAIYALATALSMPSRVRGRIHLLAPWIPPSQLTPQRQSTSTHLNGSGKSTPKRKPSTPQPTVPRSQRILRLIPTPFFKLTNAGGFLAARSNKDSDTKSSPSYGTSSWSRKSTAGDSNNNSRRPSLTSRVPRPSFLRTAEEAPPPPSPTLTPQVPHLDAMSDQQSMEAAVLRAGASPASTPRPGTASSATRLYLQQTHSSIRAKLGTPAPPEPTPRQRAYDAALTPLIWDLSTRNANPHIDLVVCLERQRPIGFQYSDVQRAVVIRHGSRDGRVPVENAVWLGGVMRGAEIRVLDGEGHGLMGRAGVMGDVLADVAAECVR